MPLANKLRRHSPPAAPIAPIAPAVPARGNAAAGKNAGTAPPRRLLPIAAAIAASLAVAGPPSPLRSESDKPRLRVATFNTSLNRPAAGDLIRELEEGSPQARQIAAVLQRVRPDIVLLNEFDFDASRRAAALFVERYVSVSQRGLPPLKFRHTFTGPVNTGLPTGRDLNRDGQFGGPADAAGFGRFPGQYGMLVLSQRPIETERVRTFQKLLWKDLPGALLPEIDGRGYYSPEDLEVLPLSSKSHWDVPIRVGAETLHVLASHPTPPVFDGPEDRNGRRNFDEIRFWADYIAGGSGEQTYLVDDRGRAGGLPATSKFVILGDLNADPFDGESRERAVRQLTEHPRVSRAAAPRSAGALASDRGRGHRGPAAEDTAQFGAGNFRVDYALPSENLRVIGGGVFWPAEGDEDRELLQASDHRLVWIDLAL